MRSPRALQWLLACALLWGWGAGLPQEAQGTCKLPARLPSVETLQAASGCDGATVVVQGYGKAGDGGGGAFRWVQGATHASGDGGTVFPAARGGWWVRRQAPEDVVNVKWFGARGDGADVPELNANAFNEAIQSLSDGGVVEVPGPGVYVVGGGKSRIELASNVTLRGTGGEQVAELKAPEPGASRMILIGREVVNTVIENLKIDLRSSKDYRQGITKFGNGCIVRNNYFYDSTYYLPSDHPAYTGDENWTRYAVWNTGSNLQVYENEFRAVQAKVTQSGRVSNIDVLHNRFIDSQAYAVTVVTGREGASIEDVRVNDNYMYNFRRGGIAAGVDGNSFEGIGSTFKNIEISGNHVVIGPNLMKYRWGIFVRALGRRGQVDIFDNRVESHESAGRLGGNQIRLVKATSNGRAQLTDLTIRNNRLHATQRLNYVIEVSPGATQHLLIEGNEGSSNSRGIRIRPANRGVIIRDNEIASRSYGLRVEDSENVNIEQNVFTTLSGAEGGSAIQFWSERLLTGRFVRNVIREEVGATLSAAFSKEGEGAFELVVENNELPPRLGRRASSLFIP